MKSTARYAWQLIPATFSETAFQTALGLGGNYLRKNLIKTALQGLTTSALNEKPDKQNDHAKNEKNLAEQEGDEIPARQILWKLGGFLWSKGHPELRWKVVGSVGLLIGGKLINVQVPVMLKYATDALMNDPTGAIPVASLAMMTPAMLVASYGSFKIASSFCNELRRALFSHVSSRAERVIAGKLFATLLTQDLKFHLDRQTGGLTRIVDRGVRGMKFILGAFIFTMVPTALEVALVTALLGYRCGTSFGILTIGSLSAYTFFTLAVTQWRLAFRKEMNKADQQAMTLAVDALVNYETIKLFQAGEHEKKRHDVFLAKYEESTLKTSYSLAFLNFGQSLILSGTITVAMLLATQEVVEGRLTVGDVIMVNALLIQLTMPLNFLGSVYRETRQAIVDMGDMFKLLESKPTIVERPDSVDLLDSDHGYDIEFQNVGFSYRKDWPILKDLSFTVPAGTSCAIVGTSGTGKSTILRLLHRFYEPDEGIVKIGGCDIRNLTFRSLRSALGQVPQDMVLFNESIFYNIQYGRLDATKEEVYTAAKAASIHDAILAMPNGYDTMVGERGLKLSGGEKQRVAIARVFLQSPQILLFDEATSALDTPTEKDIMEAVYNVAQRKTSIFVAHRLSTAARCDKIVVLDGGYVVESGTHAELVEKGGLYSEMWARVGSEGEFMDATREAQIN